MKASKERIRLGNIDVKSMKASKERIRLGNIDIKVHEGLLKRRSG
jgi:hypothetical protein